MHFEICGMELLDYNLIVLSVYRPPNGDLDLFLDSLDKCLGYLVKQNRDIVLGGDFNVTFNMPSAHTENLETILRGQGLFITSRTPTRGDRCLDSIATSLNVWDYNVEVSSAEIADHLPVLMSVKKTPMVSKPPSIPWHDNYTFYRRTIDENVLPQFKEALHVVDWTPALTDTDPVSSFKAFYSKLLEVFNLYFPLATKSNPKTKPNKRNGKSSEKGWYTPELGRFRALMQLIFDRYKAEEGREQRHKLFSLYLKAKREYKYKVNEAKKQATVDLINSSHNKCKAAWTVINESRKKNELINNKSSPDEFNHYFVNIVKDIVNDISHLSSHLVGNNSAASRVQVPTLVPLEKWRPITHKEVTGIVKAFSNSRSPDIHGLSPCILKFIIDEISIPLSEVINRCLGSGHFPDCLKLSRTIPVYKKGDVNLTSSYRPISIIPTVGKIIEKIIQGQIVAHFEANNFFADSQHGFRKSRSTTTALVSLITETLDSFECKQSMALILCDLSKAFDVVAHDVLLEKLASYGVGGVALHTFKSYLEGRSQMVAVQGALSSAAEIKYGVPQGSVVGPTLFLILMNDLGWEGGTLLFADDTTLLGRGQNPATAVTRSEHLFEEAKDWFLLNKLKLNEEKTQRLLLTLSRSSPSPDPPVKLLGFILDSRLQWDPHISAVCIRLSRVIFLLRKLKYMITKQYLMTVYFSLFHSHVAYGIQLWGHASGCTRVLRLQKQALRIITNSARLEPCRPLFKLLNVFTIFNQYIFVCVVHVKTNLSQFEARGQLHSHNIRSAQRLNTQRCRLSLTRDSFPAVAVKMYNALPHHIRELETETFRRRVRELLLQNPYYSVQEYLEESETLGCPPPSY